MSKRLRKVSGTPTVHRCRGCACRFAILSDEKPGRLRCPSCGKDETEDVDVVAELGGSIAKKIIDWWKTLPTE